MKSEGTSPVPARRPRRAFSLLEVMIVVIVIGVLAAMVVPRFAGVNDEARAAAAVGALSSIRAAVAAYRTEALLLSRGPYPALSDLTTPGRVLQQELPANPFNGLRTAQAVTANQAAARTVTGTFGWNYFVDNTATPPRALIYLNSGDTTTVPDGSGGLRKANEL